MNKRILYVFLAFVIMVTACIVPFESNAQENENPIKAPVSGVGGGVDTSNLVKSITFEMAGKNPEIAGANKDTAPYEKFKNPLTMEIKLKYDPQTNGIIKKGDSLKIQLKNLQPTTDNYITFHGSASIDGDFNGKVDETGELKKIGYLKFSRDGINLVFEDFNEPFNATISLKFAKLNDYNIDKYFANNPEATKLELITQLFINDLEQDRYVKLFLPKPTIQEPTKPDLYKTGMFWPEDNKFLYNIRGITQLRKTNEVLFFDTPDVNLAFNSELKFFITKSGNDNNGMRVIYSIPTSRQSYFNFTKYDQLNKPNWGAAIDPSKADPTDFQMWLYDIYYKVDDVDYPKTQVPMAEYKEQTIKLTHPLLPEDQKNSIEPVSQPKHILFYVPTGQELTEEQKTQIENAGGLNKKVGKGFFIRAYNLQNPLISKGTYFYINYNMEIVNQSQVKNDKDDPLYFNSMSYYLQEIPNCPPGATCTPIQAERSKVADSNMGGKLNVNNPIIYSNYNAEISKYKPINIVKQDDKGNPVAGAEFTIYKVNNDGSRGPIAKNNYSEEMTNLISDANGKLVDKTSNKAARIYLEKGKYELVETKVPDGYENENVSKVFDVVKGAVNLKIVNKKTGSQPDPDPGTNPSYQVVNIKKQDDKGNALEGAEFTIYEINEDGSRGPVAKNKDKVELSNLISNKDGKLVDKTSKELVTIELVKGKYTLVETKAPKGYTADSQSTEFEVKDQELTLTITNKKSQETPDPDQPKPDNPDKPKPPVNPDKPVKPTPDEPERPEPNKPLEPNVPSNPEPNDPIDPNKPVEPEKPVKPSKPGTSEPEKPSSPEKPTSPKTGDDFAVLAYSGIGMLSVLLLVKLLEKRKSKNSSK